MHLQHVVILLNFAYIGLLPRIFFKKGGKLNGNWWLTAAPFALTTTSLLATAGGLTPSSWQQGYFAVVSLVLSMLSVSLISFAIGSNKRPLSLWHQNDAPEEIVSWGAYRFIRHPFYAAFLLAFASAFFAAPNLVSLASWLLGYLLLNRTAALEERKLSNSDLAAQYKSYLRQTGRFLPRLRVTNHA
jgi:protein-S-isoprenylcysteine O-methyltransferase Ste14